MQWLRSAGSFLHDWWVECDEPQGYMTRYLSKDIARVGNLVAHLEVAEFCLCWCCYFVVLYRSGGWFQRVSHLVAHLALPNMHALRKQCNNIAKVRLWNM